MRIFSQETEGKTSIFLKKAGMDADARKYLFLCLLLSFFFSLPAAILLSLIFFLAMLLSVSSFLILFGLSFLILCNLPKSFAQKRGERMEAELPPVLGEIALFLDLGMPYETAIEKIAQGNYYVSGEFERALFEIKAGASVSGALLGISKRVESRHLLRAVNQIISSYEYGTGGENLRRLSQDLADLQKAKTREFSSRMGFLGVLFIAASSLVPAFFQVLLVVLSSLPQANFPQYYMWLAFVLLFPAVDFLILALVWMLMPSSMHNAGKFSVFSSLEKMGVRKENAIIACAGAVFFGVLFCIAGIFYNPLFLIGIVLFASPFLAYAFLEYLEGKRVGEMENALPDALFHAASLQKIARQEQIIEAIASSGYGPLSEEFAAAGRQIKSGISMSLALSDISARSSSRLLERVNSLLLHGYKSGGEIRRALRDMAENIFSSLSLERERAAMLSMQKATILIGGAILVPLILGSVVSMVSSIDFEENPIFEGNGGIPVAKGDLILANQLYLAAYSLLSSLMVGQMEGKRSRFLPYFIFMCLSSLLLFSFAANAAFLKVDL